MSLTATDRAAADPAWAPLFAAWGVATAATLGAVFIGEVLGQAPCVLCWWQRVAMFPLALILGIAALREDADVWVYALPLALAGTCVALWHSLLYVGVIPAAIQPCGIGPSCTGDTMAILGLPLPFLSLAAFAAVSGALLLVLRRSRP